MKQNKYRNFELTLKDGSKIMVKSTGPNKVTEKYAMALSSHWYNFARRIDTYNEKYNENALKSEDILEIKGIS